MLPLFHTQNRPLQSAPNFDVTITATTTANRLPNGNYKVVIGAFSATETFTDGNAQVKLPADSFSAGVSISAKIYTTGNELAATTAGTTLLPIGQTTTLRYTRAPFAGTISPTYLTFDGVGSNEEWLRKSNDVAYWKHDQGPFLWVRFYDQHGNVCESEQEYTDDHFSAKVEPNWDGMPRQTTVTFTVYSLDGRSRRVSVQIEQEG